MSSPGLSIVTPSYNQGPFIERTIRSVLSQSPPAVEYVVMDGGSSDQTLTLLTKHQGQLRWISAPDKGQADAVNGGIERTTADVIGWLNSDDIYYNGAFAKVLDCFSTFPDVDVVYGLANHIDRDDGVIEVYDTCPWNPELLERVCFICQPAAFFRRRVVDRYGPLDVDLKYCMDYEFWLRLSRHGVKFHYLPQLLAGSRMYAENKTLGQTLAVHTEINRMLMRVLGRVPDNWVCYHAHYLLRHYRSGMEKNALLICAAAALGSLYWNHGISQEIWHWIRTRLRNDRAR